MYAPFNTRGHGEGEPQRPPEDAEQFQRALAEFVGLLMFRTLRGRTVAEATPALRADAANLNAMAVINSERPWVGPMTVSPEFVANNSAIKAWAIIKNTGRTPALFMRAVFRPVILPKGAVPEIPSVADAPPKALFPEALDYYHPYPAGKPLTFSENIRDGIEVIWVCGRIEYVDGQGNPHHTNVRTYWDWTPEAFVPHYGNDAN